MVTPVLRAGVAESRVPTLFVAPIQGTAGKEVAFWQPAIGEGLAEMLITELTRLKKFHVLESTGSVDLKKEIALGEEGWVALDENVNKGEWRGADFMFRARITRFGESGNKYGGRSPIGIPVPVPEIVNPFRRGGSVVVATKKAEVQIDWRMVDVARREIIHSGRAIGEHSGMGWKFSTAMGSGFHNTEEFRESALGKATMKALEAITSEVSTLNLPLSGRKESLQAKEQKEESVATTAQQALLNTPGQVTGTAGKDIVVVSLGSQHGFKPGDKLKVYELVDTKDDQGKVIFTEEKVAGELLLEAVNSDSSKGRYAGTGHPQKGWIVKNN